MVSPEIIPASSMEIRQTGGIRDEIVAEWGKAQRTMANVNGKSKTRPMQQADDLLGKLPPPQIKSFTPPPNLPPVVPERELETSKCTDTSGKT